MEEAVNRKPNIVICMADQLRNDLRASRGYGIDTMPFLDSLPSRGGLEFDRAYTPNPTCTPARVSMLTGRVPSAHNVRTNHNAGDALYTEDLLDVLKANGYRTALCGKNHSHRKPEDFDFHEVNGHLGVEDGQPLAEGERKLDAFLKTLDFCDSAEPSPFTVEEQLPHRNVSSFLRFFDSCMKDAVPAFAWVSFAEPHNPYQVPRPYYDMFPPESLPEVTTSKETLAGKAPNYAFAHWSWEKAYGEGKKGRILRDRSNYLGMLRLIDDEISRLVGGIEERGEMDNTLFVFVSDHGEFIGEYDMIRKGCGVAEVLASIPMVMLGAGVEKSGHERKAFASLIDLFPTICDLIGAKVPFGVQGKSLLPIMQGTSYPEKDFELGYSESGFGGLYWDKDRDALDPVAEGAATNNWRAFDCLNSWSQCGATRMVRKDRWKLVCDMMGSIWLYDIESDPLETRDLSEDARLKDVLTDLLTEMNALSLRLTDPIPSCRWRYRTKTHPRGYWFDEDYTADKDPGVEYHSAEPKGWR